MKLLQVEDIIMLHRTLSEMTGGSPELRDRGLLESAVYSANASFGGVECYPTLSQKAARLAYALIANHAFVDGNKRIGILAMLVTLRMNAVTLSFTQAELIDLGLSAASGKMGYEQILAWIERHDLSNK